MKTKFLILYLLTSPVLVYAQHIMGTVLEVDKDGKQVPLEGANVYFPGTSVGYTTGADGMFHLDKPDTTMDKFVVSFIGFVNDTVTAEGTNIKVVMKKAIELKGVDVTSTNPDSYISSLKTAKTEIISTGELRNNACCNLSESFESNPTVDVSYSDAITGAKQIQMLGLSGKYSQILTDVLPTVRGLSIAHGLNFIPGPWIESINLNKGVGSVANGYESITGQIDVELKKPEKSEPLYLNLYGNSEERFEANLYSAQQISHHWDHLILLHGNLFNNKMDQNKDGFLDQPINHNFSVMDRWKFNSEKRIESMFGVKYSYDDRWGGATEFSPDDDKLTTTAYGFGMTTHHGEAFLKSSYNFPSKPYQSVGLQLTGTYHDQQGYFGLREFDGHEKSLFANLIILSQIKNTKHKFKTGISYLLDDYRERFDTLVEDRNESVPGAYFEYTYDDLNKWSVIAGVRGDLHNIYGFEFTPRLHVKYKIAPFSTLRASAGSGFRVSNILAENSAYFASSRQFIIEGNLEPEKAWNYGLNFTQKFFVDSREGTFSIDLYRTDFVNQIIADVDADPTKVFFYNLDGKSFANSLQAEVSLEVLQNLNVKLAYKYYDVQQTFNETLREAPLTPKHRALAVLTYKTPDQHWNFSFTTQWLGEQRLPITSSNPEAYQMPATSPSYFRLLGQISYSIKQWEFYAGSENISNYTQQDRIIAADDPFGPYFDTSIIWGPITERMFYAGLRFSILQKQSSEHSID